MKPAVTHTDLLVVGGGINGAGIALDAVGRGLSVRLVEKNDFASATSSASSKLIHGGLRYLEHYEFRLVREALAEREVLLKKAPHLVKPLRFILPHRPHLRPAWMVRSGLFLYDHLGGRSSFRKSNGVKFKGDSPLQKHLKKGFEYSDCWVDDARLVILNLIDLAQKGGHIHNYTECQSVHLDQGLWRAQLLNKHSGKVSSVTATALVNATGPWVQSFIEDRMQARSAHKIRLIKGSHLIVPRVYKGDECYILQNEDKRIVFVIPYLNDYMIIGTTDKEHEGKPDNIAIDDQEIHYLLEVYNQHFKYQLTQSDIVAYYSGVRPLCDDESDDPSAITRDYTLTLEKVENQAYLLNVFGGKLTTYRKLAEAAIKELRACFPDLKPAWTHKAPLPGANALLDDASFAKKYPFVPKQTRMRWLEAYGGLAKKIIGDANTWSDLGEDLGHGLTQREVDYLLENEWACCSEDILYRRTKLYLKQSQSLEKKLKHYMSERFSSQDNVIPSVVETR